MTVTSTADLSRLATLPPLAKGAHKRDENVACIMEAVAFVAGERWSDHPVCACRVIGEFLRLWNDALPDSERDALLRPLVPMMVGTRSTKAVERRRAMMAVDWLIREHTPAWLRLAGLTRQANALAGLPEITDTAQCPLLMPMLDAVRKDANAAWAAAGDVAWAAAGATAWDASGAAAGAAARAAAGVAAGTTAWATAWATAGTTAWATAGAAAGVAAWAAAGDAAGAAARAAAGVALKPTTASLQQSALGLVHRMIGAAT